MSPASSASVSASFPHNHTPHPCRRAAILRCRRCASGGSRTRLCPHPPGQLPPLQSRRHLIQIPRPAAPALTPFLHVPFPWSVPSFRVSVPVVCPLKTRSQPPRCLAVRVRSRKHAPWPVPDDPGQTAVVGVSAGAGAVMRSRGPGSELFPGGSRHGRCTVRTEVRTPLLGAGARHDERPSEAFCRPILDVVPNPAE